MDVQCTESLSYPSFAVKVQKSHARLNWTIHVDFFSLVTGDWCALCSMHAIPWTQKSCKSWHDTNKNICIAPCSKSLLAQGPGQNLFPSPIVCLTATKDTPVYRGVCCYVPISSSVFSAHSNLPARPASPGAGNRCLGPGLSSVESCPRWREDTHTNTAEMVARRRRENYLYT